MINTHELARRPRTIVATALIAGLLAAGCGGSDGDGEATASTTTEAENATEDTTDDATTTTQASETDGSVEESDEACDIVSDEVAAEVLGVEIVRREGNTDPASGGYSCIKGTERQNDPAQFHYVSASVIPGGGSIMSEQFAAQEGSEPVDGLGDSAQFVPNLGVLIVVDGADALQVQVVKGGVPSSDLDDCVKVAEDILDRRG